MLTLSFTPFPILESDRLLLRAVTVDDVNEVMELRGNPETMKFIPRPLVTSPEMALEHIAMIIEKIEKQHRNQLGHYVKRKSKIVGCHWSLSHST